MTTGKETRCIQPNCISPKVVGWYCELHFKQLVEDSFSQCLWDAQTGIITGLPAAEWHRSKVAEFRSSKDPRATEAAKAHEALAVFFGGETFQNMISQAKEPKTPR